MDARSSLFDVLQAGALLTIGIVYGTDAFFSIVGSKALARTSAAGLTEAIGRIHEVADQRMPIIGAAGLVLSAGTAIAAETSGGRLLGGAAAVAIIVYVVLYTRLSKPINDRLVDGARKGEAVADAHALQRRWDRVVDVRYVLMTAAMLCLTFADR